MEVSGPDESELDLGVLDITEAGQKKSRAAHSSLSFKRIGGHSQTAVLSLASIPDWLLRLTTHGAPLPTQPRPNTSPLFRVYEPTLPPLQKSPSPLYTPAWEFLLQPYPGELRVLIQGMLTYGCQIGYVGPEQFHISKNLRTARLAPDVIQGKIQQDLRLQRVTLCSGTPPFMCSPLGLVPKHDGGWRRIHHLSHPRGTSVNDYIPKEYGMLDYANIYQIYDAVLAKGRGAIIVKKDIKDAFRIIPVAPHQRWLLGFQWENRYYQEEVLSFGLRTAPFLFNLVAEAFHWILEAWLGWELFHYLDDFIRVVPDGYKHQLRTDDSHFHQLTHFLGIPENSDKEVQGTTVTVLGIEIDTIALEARLPPEKLAKARLLTSKALQAGQMTRNQAEQLAGFLSFCTSVVRLGKLFMHYLWQFIAKFGTNLPEHYVKRLPRLLKNDLLWWHHLLPNFNGILLLPTHRPVIHLYTDASTSYGLGAFYTVDLDYSSIPQSQSLSIPNNQWMAREHINVLELRAIQAAFFLWGSKWSGLSVNIYTDSTSAYWGLRGQNAKEEAYVPIRHIILLASNFDTIISTRWIQGSTNLLADALSRNDNNTIANLCPHWQTPLTPKQFPLDSKEISVPPPMKLQN